MASNIFKHLIKGAAQMGQLAALGVAQKQMTAKHKREARKGGGAPAADDGLGGCTPCAAKAKGAEMANSIWK